jgi:tetratricopeptide (TPR) repeat protein
MSSASTDSDKHGFLYFVRNGVVKPSLYPSLLVAALLVVSITVATGLWYYSQQYSGLPRLSMDFLADGDAYYRDENYARALEEYTAALAIAPATPQTLVNLGATYFAMGDRGRAMSAFKRALYFKSDEPDASYNVGILYLQTERYAEAIHYLSIATRYRRGPSAALAYNDLGVAYARQGNLPDAAASYRRALEINPELVSAQNNLDSLLRRMRR